MNKANAKQILLIAAVSLVVVVAYDYTKKKINAAKTSAPATTA